MPAQPGSGAAPALSNLTSTCTSTGSEVAFSCAKGITGVLCNVELVDDLSGAPVWSDSVPTGLNSKSFLITGTADGNYTLTADNGEATTSLPVVVSCGAVGGGLVLVLKQLTQPTATTATGAATIVVNTPQGQPAPTLPVSVDIPGLTAGPVALTTVASGYQYDGPAVAPGTYSAAFTDSSTPALTLSVDFTIDPQPVVVIGCQDEYATDYDPAATSDTTPSSCTYAPLWRSAWQPMAVRVAATAGQTAGYITANLSIGFRAGHPLAADRPLGDALELFATVGPDGYATFRLGPYLRSQLGAADGSGGYRLDLNSPTAHTADLYVGYELRRPNGELLEHGYALNAAVPDGELQSALSPFSAPLPVWPGFAYIVSTRYSTGPVYQFGAVGSETPDGISDVLFMPCPANPIPVAWLAPGCGFGFWVFQGRPELGDAVGDGQAYNEAGTGEQRWSQRGESRDTITATSGVFKGRDLMEGLRTLWRSPQVWYMPEVGGPWVAVTLEPGSFSAGRLGVNRQQVSISFTHAAPEWAQGQ